MWLSKRSAEGAAGRAQTGIVTLGGARAAVYTDAERRGLLTYAPGGYTWRPRAGDTLLVVKNEGGAVCALGSQCLDAPAGMADGEVYIKSDAASVWLKNDGSVAICGNVSVEGSLLVNGIAVT